MPFPGLDRPPAPAPNIQGQMGVPQAAPPGMGLGALRPGGVPAQGAPDPHGSTAAQVAAITKVLEQIGRAEPVMAPFAQRATSILEAGLSAVRAAPMGPEDAGIQQSPGPSGPMQGQGAYAGEGPPMG